ncbi:hypothetical protein WR25_26498 [Diploscapter pachys]|uniref:RING-type E3 ubiquitin transferase n=1 Tax=Diploscapter pachys TaxID=2018661 RepID=A0A2A2LIB1_9BILA|nr:hypothetical protein WR25_26498 [Diploscapter pachys]
MNNPSQHDGVSCDGCEDSAFTGNRYKCLRCVDFDLCHSCYINKIGANSVGSRTSHSIDHPMQLILTHRDFEAAYEGDTTKSYDVCKVASFTCPYCNTTGYSIRSFANHIITVHNEPPSPPVIVMCPICIALPDCDGNREITDLRAHYSTEHANVLNIDNYRSEPARANVVRRPMLARRTPRQTAAANRQTAVGGGTNLLNATPTAQPFGIPWHQLMGDGTIEVDMDEMIRNIPGRTPLGNVATDIQQRLINTQLINSLQAASLGNLTAANLLRSNLSARTAGVSGLSAVASQAGANEYAQPRSATSLLTRQMSVPPLPPSVRPMRLRAIFPVSNEHHQSSSDELEEFDELTEVFDESDADTNQIFANDSDEEERRIEKPKSSEENEEEKQQSGSTSENGQVLKNGETKVEKKSSRRQVSSDDDLNPLTEEEESSLTKTQKDLRRKIDEEEIWKDLSENLSNEEMETLLTALKNDSGFEFDDDEDEAAYQRDRTGRLNDAERAKSTRNGAGNQHHSNQEDKAVSELSQCYLSMQIHVPSIASFGCGFYWEDNRFLSHKRRQSSQNTSTATETKNPEALLAKADKCLAALRTFCGEGADFGGQLKLKNFDSADKSLRRILKAHPLEKLELVPNSYERSNIIEANMLAETSRRLAAETSAVRVDGNEPSPGIPELLPEDGTNAAAATRQSTEETRDEEGDEATTVVNSDEESTDDDDGETSGGAERNEESAVVDILNRPGENESV